MFLKRYAYKIWILVQKYTADYTISQLNSTLEDILEHEPTMNMTDSSWNQEWDEDSVLDPNSLEADSIIQESKF